MCCFIVGLPIDIRFEKDLETDVAHWHYDIDAVNV